jgi:spermidine synthase
MSRRIGFPETGMRRRAIACVLAFVSGFAALGYELVWLRRLGHLWGGSALPEMFLTTCFVVGLGVGGALLAKRLLRFDRPLLALGAVEFGIGACGLAFETVLRGLWTLHASLIGADAPAAVRWAGALAATAVVVCIPASLMGTTTLLLCRYLESQDDARTKPAGGLLFGVNTVGAGAGCLLTGFVLLPRLGLDASGTVFAAANAVVACTALGWNARVAATAATRAAGAPAPVGSGARPLVAAALLGFLGMGLEFGWIRELVLILGGSVYAFQSVLFVLLVGLGLGGLLGARLVRDRGADGAAWRLAALVVLGGAVGQACVSWLASAVGVAAPLRTTTTGNLAVCVATSSIVLGAASVGMGGLFVAALAFARDAAGGAESEALRRVTFANCVGGAVAGWVVMFHGLPTLGVETTIAALLFGFGPVRAFLLRGASVRPAGAFALCAVAAAAAAGARSTIDGHALRMGQFMYGARSAADLARSTTLFREDGRSCSVLVERSDAGETSFRVNGKVDGGSGDMDMQMGVACLPLFLRPLARDVLVVGYGTGTSCHAAALWPGTSVTCCEIEPAVVAGARWFDELNHGDVAGPRVRIVDDDGRRFLQGADATFDVVVSEPSNPWLAGVTNLYTREFYETAGKRLNPRGIFVQWAQTYSFSRDDYRAVLATVRSVFPDAVVIRISAGDSLVVACKDDAVLPAAGFASTAQERVDSVPVLRHDLLKYFGTSNVRRLLAARLVLGRDEVDALCGASATVITDRNLRLEYDTPLRVFGAFARTNEVDPMLLDSIGTPWMERVHAALDGAKDETEGLLELWDACYLARCRRGQATTAAAWNAVAPTDVRAAVRLLMSAPGASKEDVRKTAAAAVALSRSEAMRLAIVLRDQDRADEAIEVLRVVVAKNPGDGEAAYLLCQAYLRAGRADAARAAFDAAVAVDPCHAMRAGLAKAVELMKQ